MLMNFLLGGTAYEGQRSHNVRDSVRRICSLRRGRGRPRRLSDPVPKDGLLLALEALSCGSQRQSWGQARRLSPNHEKIPTNSHRSGETCWSREASSIGRTWPRGDRRVSPASQSRVVLKRGCSARRARRAARRVPCSNRRPCLRPSTKRATAAAHRLPGSPCPQRSDPTSADRRLPLAGIERYPGTDQSPP